VIEEIDAADRPGAQAKDKEEAKSLRERSARRIIFELYQSS
jgi:hypothetical protein